MADPITRSQVVVSRRISIAWPTSRDLAQRIAHEPTDTLVLRFDGYYLDLRVSSEANPSGVEASRPLPLGADPAGKIVWAQAGKVVKTPKPNDPSGLPDIDFLPIADSVPPPPSHIPRLPDSGTFETLPNGHVAEMGWMYNEGSRGEGESWGRNEEYVEVWRRLEPSKLYAEELEELGHGDQGDPVPSSGEGRDGAKLETLLLEAEPWVIDHDNGSRIMVHTFIGRAGVRALGIRVAMLHGSDDSIPTPVFVSGFRDYLATRTSSKDEAVGDNEEGAATSKSAMKQVWTRVYSSSSSTPLLDGLSLPAAVLARMNAPLPRLPESGDESWKRWPKGGIVEWSGASSGENTGAAARERGTEGTKWSWIVREIEGTNQR